LTILLGYNTPIKKGLQGTAQTPYLNRRGAVSQKQSGNSATVLPVVTTSSTIAIWRPSPAIQGERHFSGSFAQPGIELMLDGAVAWTRQALRCQTQPSQRANGRQSRSL
jgi:hypothetical protein